MGTRPSRRSPWSALSGYRAVGARAVSRHPSEALIIATLNSCFIIYGGWAPAWATFATGCAADRRAAFDQGTVKTLPASPRSGLSFPTERAHVHGEPASMFISAVRAPSWVDIDLDGSEVVALVGGNGAGKRQAVGDGRCRWPMSGDIRRSMAPGHAPSMRQKVVAAGRVDRVTRTWRSGHADVATNIQGRSRGGGRRPWRAGRGSTRRPCGVSPWSNSTRSRCRRRRWCPSR